MKNIKDPTGNWSGDIPGCSAGPQTALPWVLTFITNTRLQQTRPRGNEAAKTCAWQVIHCPHAWTKSIVRSVPRQYTEVSGADIDILLWIVTCYPTWIGTRITNTELLREGARFGHLNISRNCFWTGFRWTLGPMLTCSRREKSLLLPRINPGLPASQSLY